jgi:hypothetical protein
MYVYVYVCMCMRFMYLNWSLYMICQVYNDATETARQATDKLMRTTGRRVVGWTVQVSFHRTQGGTKGDEGRVCKK